EYAEGARIGSRARSTAEMRVQICAQPLRIGRVEDVGPTGGSYGAAFERRDLLGPQVPKYRIVEPSGARQIGDERLEILAIDTQRSAQPQRLPDLSHAACAIHELEDASVFERDRDGLRHAERVVQNQSSFPLRDIL